MIDPSQARLRAELEQLLARDGATASALARALDLVLEAFDCKVGTLHSLDPATGMLALRAHRGIPDMLLDKVSRIPIGKGMAGIAAERREPVQMCNLQTDASGVARPGAKETRVEGSLTVPILVDGALRGTLGIGKRVPYDFTGGECQGLLELGTLLGAYLD